ncbi:flp pilus-assembly TadE/G-like family protein [Solwaraspora sp. WMMD937]|uniref:Rv3654c family TadE-like protein n=1 Tax=Solwaraspora sp. WMMD937 TaxID=3016090 RepID=UPI002499AF5C|nr:Rv3654c family TadE-like protein [Solwaraspora sp. WMMD937]WFE23102.1 flp pilus-assembly TadE/G-like family protein [Solwaraspora sp. WMMD937]
MTGRRCQRGLRGLRDPGRPRRPGADVGQRGSASLWLLAVGLTLVAAGMAGALIGAVRLARQQASVAADLAALAGAARVFAGQGVVCERAAEVAGRNGGRLRACSVDGMEVVVTVEVTPLPATGVGRPVSATARAGPLRADPWEGADARADPWSAGRAVGGGGVHGPAGNHLVDVVEPLLDQFEAFRLGQGRVRLGQGDLLVDGEVLRVDRVEQFDGVGHGVGHGVLLRWRAGSAPNV